MELIRSSVFWVGYNNVFESEGERRCTVTIVCKKLGKGLRGELIQPDDQRYDTARKLYKGMIDRRPRAIARCADVSDVITAVRFAREHELLLAVRGGGHNGGGLGSCDDGLVIDLSRMKGVRVDPARRVQQLLPDLLMPDRFATYAQTRGIEP